MDRWRVSDGREKASELALSLYDRVEASFSRYPEQKPKILEISFIKNREAHHICCLEIELFTGCTVEIASGYIEKISDFIRDGTFDENEAHANTIAWIEHFQQIGYDHLDDLLHEVRCRVRRKAVEWRAGGLPAQLSSLSIEVNADDLWLGYMPISVRIDTFCDRLGPQAFYLDGKQPDDFSRSIDGFEQSLRRRLEERNFFDSLGADGIISQIALDVLRHHGDLRQEIKAIHNGTFLNDRNLGVYKDGSKICAQGYIAGARHIEIKTASIWVEGLELPEVMRLRCVGQPITQLISMPYLSDSIRIASLENRCRGPDFADGVCINFDQPEFLYCGHSGRYWLPEENCRLGKQPLPS